jgi:hypothetical protein
MAEKFVSVDVIGGVDNNLTFEIIFSNCDEKEMSDTTSIANKIKTKNRFLKSEMEDGLFHFERQSNFNKDKWVVIGDDSPVKTDSILRCVINQKSVKVSPLPTDFTDNHGEHNL